jgi:hypothetical protein
MEKKLQLGTKPSFILNGIARKIIVFSVFYAENN